MRHGKKEQMFASVFKLFVMNKLQGTKTLDADLNCINLITLLPILTSTNLTSENLYQTFYYDKLKLGTLNKTIEAGSLIHPQDLQLSTFLTNNLEKYKPVFMFKVQKVDKKTRKNSRGKSGKYLIL